MNNIVIKDLEMSKELDRKAMTHINGGLLQALIVWGAARVVIWGIDKVTGRDNRAW